MFKAMLKYRLSSIWLNLIIAFIIVEGPILISELIVSVQYSDFSIVTDALGFSLVMGGLMVTQGVLIILSFATVRKPFDFGILNGISRKTSFTTQLVSLYGSQLVTFMVFYPMLNFLISNKIGPDWSLMNPQVIMMILVVIWSIMAGAIAISSFVTLFEPKIWWVIFIAWLILSRFFEAYIQPIIMNLLPGWVHYYSNLNLLDTHSTILGQPYFWTFIVTSIIIPLVFAGVCQYFMQTKRIALSFKRPVK